MRVIVFTFENDIYSSNNLPKDRYSVINIWQLDLRQITLKYINYEKAYNYWLSSIIFITK